MENEQEVRVLLVDDDAALLRAHKSALERDDFIVTGASNGKEAAALVKEQAFDVIVSDISMPEMTGIEFLKAVRAHDLDVPVILITGAPSIESAAMAVEYGAFRYLAKPVDIKVLRGVSLRAARLHKIAKLKQQAIDLFGKGVHRLGEQAALEVRFSSAVDLLWVAFQPIVSFRARRVFGYEALLRSDEPLMRNPGDILEAAERLDRLKEVGRTVRAKVAAQADKEAAGTAKFFVNLHSSDLNDEELYSPDSPLARVADRVVLEITERASLHGIKNVATCVARLKSLGYQIAVDDLGAGYAGLTSFTQLDPEIAKLDMSLIRGLDEDPRRRSIVRSMRSLCDDLKMLVIAEGLETAGERDALTDLGCDLLQGYLFAKPARELAEPRW